MQAHHRKSVCLLLTATDLPVWSGVETVATLYQKDQEQFHLLMTEPTVCDRDPIAIGQDVTTAPPIITPRLLWLEFSPYRVTLTMQGQGQFSYRHCWHRGVYGPSQYWLHNEIDQPHMQFHLQNFTRDLTLSGKPLPNFLRVEYELWTAKMPLGHYVLNLEIRH